jgi:hypothetical protein
MTDSEVDAKIATALEDYVTSTQLSGFLSSLEAAA